MKDEMLGRCSIWVSAGCYACSTACPERIPITDMMCALKRTAIRDGVRPRRFGTPVVAREFVGSVDQFGGATESRLAVRLCLKTHPRLRLQDVGVRAPASSAGPHGARRKSIRRRGQVGTMVRVVGTRPRRAPTSERTPIDGSEGAQ